MVNLSLKVFFLGAALAIPKEVRAVEGSDTPDAPRIAACGNSEFVGGTIISPGTAGCLDDHEVFLAPEDNYVAVRCCSDVDLGPKWHQNRGCSVFAGTIDLTGYRCPRKMTYSQAEQYCAYAGGRLCTSEEVVNDCTVGTGCRFDTEMVWTSSTELAKIEDPIVVTCGRTEFVGGEIKSRGTAGCFTEHQVLVDPTTALKLNVRCCSDVDLGFPWKKNTWCSAWVATQFPDEGCNAKMTYTQAVNYCEDRGGRLCTTEELFKDCTIGTGCGYDTEQIWTSSKEIFVQPMVVACGRSDFVGGYEKKKHLKGCDDEHELLALPAAIDAGVRCCSDVELGPPWQRNSGCSVWGATMFLNGKKCPGKMDFFEAEEFCQAAGGRLCTSEEMVKDCTMGTGCNFDTEMVWTSSTDEQLFLTPAEYVVTTCGHSQFVGGQIVSRGTAGCLRDLEVLRHPSYTRAVRCCADTYLGKPWKRNAGCSVFALAGRNPINFKECGEKMDFFQANEYCASLEGRLCTTEEVVNDCTSGTGCGLDTEMIWTSSNTAISTS